MLRNSGSNSTEGSEENIDVNTGDMVIATDGNEDNLEPVNPSEAEQSGNRKATTPVRQTTSKRKSQESPTVEESQATPQKKKKKKRGSKNTGRSNASDSEGEQISDETFIKEMQKFLAPGSGSVHCKQFRVKLVQQNTCFFSSLWDPLS